MTDAAVMPKMFLSIREIFWRRWNGVGSVFSANGDFVFHALGHFAFEASGLADTAAGKNKHAADNHHDPGGVHETDSVSFMNFSQSKPPSACGFADDNFVDTTVSSTARALRLLVRRD
jgi:hypothetical protein